MTAAEHDAAVAAISHLPLVVAAALVEAVAGTGDAPDRADWPVAAGLAASGWQGMTRLARGDTTMGAGIIATNGPAIAARVRDLRDALDAWLEELERAGGPDAASVAERLAAARRRLEARRLSDDELVFVVPRDSVMPDGGWYGLKSADLDAFLVDGRAPRPVRAQAGDGSRPRLQADHPVPRAP